MLSALVEKAKDDEIQKLSEFLAYEVTLKENIPELEAELQQKAIRLTGRCVRDMSNEIANARYVTRDFRGQRFDPRLLRADNGDFNLASGRRARPGARLGANDGRLRVLQGPT